MLAPAVFIGHGSPMNALELNADTQGWRDLAAQLPKPRAILVLSAHWLSKGLRVTAMPQPRTIHDFGGFPQALFNVRYPAPGAPEVAAEVAAALAPLPVALDSEWGLDHGAWSVLMHLFPQADVPVLQLSFDAQQPAAFHYTIGQALAPLRASGVLLLGSGNVVHNLARLDWHSLSGYPWAQRFNQRVSEQLHQQSYTPLVAWPQLDPEAALSVPTPEHYWPLLPILGSAYPSEVPHVFNNALRLGSLSMLSVAFGLPL